MIVACPGCELRYDVTGRPPGTLARCRCGTVFPLPAPAAAAGTLACPQCGAVCAPEHSRCEYCRAELATVRCPRCFGMIFAGTRHCGHCGARADAPAQAIGDGGDARRRCPRCGGEGRALVANLVGDTLLDQCNDCGGLWVDQAAFEKILEARKRQQTVEAVLGQVAPRAQVASAAVVYLRCPDCSTVMTRRNFGKRSGVLIDVCTAHGVWFDHGELPRIIEFVRGGGLEEARRREVEQLKEEARLARQDRVMEATRASLTGAYFDDSRLFPRRGSGIFGVVDFLAKLLGS